MSKTARITHNVVDLPRESTLVFAVRTSYCYRLYMVKYICCDSDVFQILFVVSMESDAHTLTRVTHGESNWMKYIVGGVSLAVVCIVVIGAIIYRLKCHGRYHICIAYTYANFTF